MSRAIEYRYETLADGVAVIRATHASGHYQNVYVLGAPGDAALVDAADPGDEAGIIGALEANGFSSSDFARLIITHEHGDHYGSAAALAEWGTRMEVVAHVHAAWVMGLRRSRYVGPPWPCGLPTREAFDAWVDAQPEPVRTDRLLWDGDGLTIGDAAWRVHHLPGHADGHVVLHDPAAGVALTGDVIQGCSEAVGWLGLFTDVASHHESMTRLAGLDASLVLMGHHNPLSGPRVAEEIARSQARLTELSGIVRDGLAAGVTEVEQLGRLAYRTIFAVELDAVPGYVATTINALLADLALRGRATLTRPPDRWE